MKIEEQIKQNKFSSETEKAVVNIAFTHSFLTGKMNRLFKPYNISMQQYNVMRILKGQHPKPVSINDITDRMIDKMSNASRLVEKLKTKKLVERNISEHDRRQAEVVLTKAGLNTLEELNLALSQMIEELKHVSDSDYIQLNNTLDKMRSK
ncbi:MarR family transcriptional regulator [bacterium]|nr:MarR family transcriptional regulator [bacterium]